MLPIPRCAIMRRARRDKLRKITASASLRGAWSRASASVRPYRLPGKPHVRHSVLGCQIEQDIGEHGMDVKIEVPVDMIEIANQLQMSLYLGAQFVAQAAANPVIEEISHTGEDGIIGEARRRAGDAGEALRRQKAAAAANHGMKANVEARIVARSGGRFCACALGHHQTGAAQHPVAVCADDTGVDLGREAEVVTRNYNLLDRHWLCAPLCLQ